MRVGPFVASMGGESLRKTDLISAVKQSDLGDSNFPLSGIQHVERLQSCSASEVGIELAR